MVLVPFTAPPTERNRKRLWITLGISGALLVLCCAGGGFGFLTLLVQSSRATETSSVTAVQDYLEGLRTGNFDKSYDQLCEEVRQRTSRTEFRDSQQSEPAVESYSVGSPTQVRNGLSVPASVQVTSGGTQNWEFLLVPEGSIGSVKICGIRQ